MAKTTSLTATITIATSPSVVTAQFLLFCNKTQYDLINPNQTFIQFDNVKPNKVHEIIEISNKSIFLAFDRAASKSNYLYDIFSFTLIIWFILFLL